MSITKLEEVKAELALLSTSDLDVDDPIVQDWLVKAANELRKEELKHGERFVIDENTKLLKKVYLN